MKTIWLINPYAVPTKYETRLRTIKFAEYLTKNGYRVYIFGGSFVHNTDINLIEDNLFFKVVEDKWGYNFVHIKTDGYKGNGLARFKNLHQFYSGFKKVYKNFEHPDIILHTVTVPFGCNIYKIAKRVNAKYNVEVLDLWPESFAAYGLIKKNGLIHKLLRKFEFKEYKVCNNLFFSMAGGIDYIYELRWDKKIDVKKIHYLNNGVDLKEFEANLLNYKLLDKDLNNQEIFKVVYLGSIRKANNVSLLINAAKQLVSDDKIKFLIYGDGTERDALEKECSNLPNVIFKQKRIDIQYVPYVVSKSDVNVLNYDNNYIWNYGGSQSKLFQYLAAGKPIISNLQIGHCIITENNCGLAKKFGDANEYASAIKNLFEMSKHEYQLLCENAKKAASFFDYEYLTKALINIVDNRNVEKIEFRCRDDNRGRLVFFESQHDLPFDIKRVYYIYDVKNNIERGFHAHKNLKQCLVCVSGSVVITIDNGKQRENILLDDPSKGLLIYPCVWREMKKFSKGAVLMIFANEYYDEKDYIRNYDDFKNYIIDVMPKEINKI